SVLQPPPELELLAPFPLLPTAPESAGGFETCTQMPSSHLASVTHGCPSLQSPSISTTPAGGFWQIPPSHSALAHSPDRSQYSPSFKTKLKPPPTVLLQFTTPSKRIAKESGPSVMALPTVIRRSLKRPPRFIGR